MSEDERRFNDPKLAINRVYTRHGDGGETRLVGGQKIPKDDLRIECYGTVDTLNAQVGAARLSCLEAGASYWEDDDDDNGTERGFGPPPPPPGVTVQGLEPDLRRIQHALFNLGSLLATLPEDLHPDQPRVDGHDVTWLEGRIDHHNETLPPLRSFVLPGGNRANVDLHLARTLCREAERLCVRLARREPTDEWVVPYLNRLSDAFFVFSRVAVVVVDCEEELWDPNEG